MKDFREYSDENINFYNKSTPELLLELIKKTKPKSLADFGCGDGVILLGLKRRGLLDKVGKTIAIDLSKERLKRVKKNIPNITIICSDVCDVKEIGNNSLDIIISTQVIEHVTSDERLVKEIYRTLGKRGYVYISSVVKCWYGWYFYRSNGKWALDPTHLREYRSSKEFCNLLRKNGLAISNLRLSVFKPSILNFFRRVLIKYGLISEERARNSSLLNSMAKIKIPVLGYYIIEVVARKKP